MDMTKYYWEAKDANEVNLIARMANVEIDPAFEPSCGKWAIENGKLSWLFNGSTPRQTLSTLEDLFEMAKRGFREIWEVAEDGFRIATVEEREKYAYPTDCKVLYCCDSWEKSCGPGFWDSTEDQCEIKAFAVPQDYEFNKPVEITIEDIKRVCGDALRNEFGDNFKITK
jgi:hypothetical protein